MNKRENKAEAERLAQESKVTLVELSKEIAHISDATMQAYLGTAQVYATLAQAHATLATIADPMDSFASAP